MTKKLTGPLFVREAPAERDGELFLCGDAYDEERYEDCSYVWNAAPTDLDLNRRIVLDDVSLWETYEAASLAVEKACQAQKAAAQVVLRSLRKPLRTEVEIKDLPTPTRAEIQALAHLYVLDRLLSRRKINMAFSALAGISKAHIESMWDFQAERLVEVTSESVPPEMMKALYSKGWVYGYNITQSGEAQLDTAVVQGDAPDFHAANEEASMNIRRHAEEGAVSIKSS